MKRRSFLQSAAAAAALSVTTPGLAIAAKAKKGASLGPLLEPWGGPHGGIPSFDKLDTTAFKPAFAQGMDLLRGEINAITATQAAATFDNTIIPFEDSGRPFGRVQTFFGVYTSTMNDKAMQKTEEEMSPVLSAFGSEIIQNEALFARIKAVYDTRTSSNLDPLQQRLTDVYYTRFARQGAALDKDKKAKLKDINQKLASLFTKFSQNQLADEENYTLTLDSEADLAGLPPSIREAASQKGKWVFANTRSSIDPFLTFSDRRDLREKAWRMWNARGNNQNANNNRQVASDILKLRAERAQLLGFQSHAHWIVADNMAKTPEAAMGLMMKVWPAAVAPREGRSRRHAGARRQGRRQNQDRAVGLSLLCGKGPQGQVRHRSERGEAVLPA